MGSTTSSKDVTAPSRPAVRLFDPEKTDLLAMRQECFAKPIMKPPRFMETSILVTDLAQQFSLSLVGPSHPIVIPLRVARAGRRAYQRLSSLRKSSADMPDIMSGTKPARPTWRQVSVSRAKSMR